MTEFVSITVEPERFTGSGQRYRVLHEGEVIIDSSRDPQCDAARVLLAAGVDMDAQMLIFDPGCDGFCMRGRLGFFAGHRVAENASHGPRFVPWAPYSGPPREDED